MYLIARVSGKSAFVSTAFLGCFFGICWRCCKGSDAAASLCFEPRTRGIDYIEGSLLVRGGYDDGAKEGDGGEER